MALVKATPIEDVRCLPQLNNIDQLFDSESLAVFRAGDQFGVRREDQSIVSPADYVVVPNARVIIDGRNIFFCTDEWKYFQSYYPKPWVYAKFLGEDKKTIEIDVDKLPTFRLEGVWATPFLVAGNWCHRLLDNYARMYYIEQLPFKREIKIGLPQWASGGSSERQKDLGIVASLFMEGFSWEELPPGVYEVDRLIIPPLANFDDYFYEEPVKFVSRKLRERFVSGKFHHKNRLFISRSDIHRRKLDNEPVLVDELRKLGFTILCPGDYSFASQLQIFAAAEIVVGVHGQGLVPFICSSESKALLEFECSGWHFTTYRSVACAMQIPYKTLPFENYRSINRGHYDWLASAKIPETIDVIREILAQ